MLLYVRGLCKLYVDVCLWFISLKVSLKQRRRITLGLKQDSFSGPSIWVVITCEPEHILVVVTSQLNFSWVDYIIGMRECCS